MADQVNKSGGAAPGESGAESSQEVKDQQQKETGAAEESESFKKRALDDIQKWKSTAKTLEKKIQELEEKKLQETSDYKTLWENEKRSREESEGKLEKLRTGWHFNEKINAIKNECLKLGLRPEAEADLELLPLDGAVIETTSQGRVLVNGADQVAQEIKKKKPYWFKSADVPRVNAGGAGGKVDTTTELTAAKMVELEKKDPKKYRELMPKFLEQRNKKK